MSNHKDAIGQTVTTSNGETPYGGSAPVIIQTPQGPAEGTIHSGGVAVPNKKS